jgi:sensor histidine kinase regulating citrate/malate metabolism
MNHLGYIISAFLIYYVLEKYIVKSARHLMERSVKSVLLFGAIPAFYYFFDHAATVYSNFMYSGSRAAVQFMPFVTSAFYFIFVILFYEELKKQEIIQRERDLLNIQFQLAQKEFTSLRQLQENAASYRHDMRHHINLLQGFAENGRLEEIKKYLHAANSDIDSITPIRYCENETINLILSGYASIAKHSEIILTIEANLPESLPFSDTELSSLLSNALENAVHASEKIPETDKRIIHLRLFSKNNKLCIDIRNRYHEEAKFIKDFPISEEEGHGFGTKSMAHIVEKHGGVYQFSQEDGWFIFQATA